MSILVVDDSADERELLKVLLEHRGLGEIYPAASSAEAIEMLNGRGKTGDKPKINLILLDVVMPEVDGIETLRLIKGKEEFRDIPVIMVTGKNDLKNLELAFASGAVDYVTKPFQKIELIARINSALRLKREMDQRKRHEAELERALAEIKVLRGFIPICASCKKIRDDKGYWSQVEEYISERSEAKFTHGICPDCMDKLYPGVRRKAG